MEGFRSLSEFAPRSFLPCRIRAVSWVSAIVKAFPLPHFLESGQQSSFFTPDTGQAGILAVADAVVVDATVGRIESSAKDRTPS